MSFTFQTGISAAANASLEIEQVIFSVRVSKGILLSLYMVQTEGLSQFQRCTVYLARFMTFWTSLFLNELVIQLIFNISFQLGIKEKF